MSSLEFILTKMRVEHDSPVSYFLEDKSGKEINVNDWLGKQLTLSFDGFISCAACERKTKKSFSQGYCYPCFKSLARCDMCIMKPETCHYHEGTCREPDWADSHCMQAHYVYLSNASGLKVGITRQDQLPTRWIDQGAIQAIPVYKVSNRYQAGLIEVCIAESLKDKTNWRTMLKGETERLDLVQERERIQNEYSNQVEAISKKFGQSSLEILTDEPVTINYPVEHFPIKIKSYNFDKTESFTDELEGIKGQYLIFKNGVINLRKFSSYHIRVEY